MVLLYLSRRVGWLLAIVFILIAIGLYSSPETTRPIVGAMAKVTDQIVGNMFDTVKVVLSRI